MVVAHFRGAFEDWCFRVLLSSGPWRLCPARQSPAQQSLTVVYSFRQQSTQTLRGGH